MQLSYLLRPLFLHSLGLNSLLHVELTQTKGIVSEVVNAFVVHAQIDLGQTQGDAHAGSKTWLKA